MRGLFVCFASFPQLVSALTSCETTFLGELHSRGIIATADCAPSGITCSGDKIVGLTFTSKSLTGTLPDYSCLVDLTVLSKRYPPLHRAWGHLNYSFCCVTDFFNNKFTGTLPDFSNLVKLQTINFERVPLSGTIPGMEKLVNLAVLQLGTSFASDSMASSNALSGPFPSSFSHMPALRQVEIEKTLMQGTIPNLDNNAELVYLNLGSNSLSGTIPSIEHLSKLNQISVKLRTLASLGAC